MYWALSRENSHSRIERIILMDTLSGDNKLHRSRPVGFVIILVLGFMAFQFAPPVDIVSAYPAPTQAPAVINPSPSPQPLVGPQIYLPVISNRRVLPRIKTKTGVHL